MWEHLNDIFTLVTQICQCIRSKPLPKWTPVKKLNFSKRNRLRLFDKSWHSAPVPTFNARVRFLVVIHTWIGIVGTDVGGLCL